MAKQSEKRREWPCGCRLTRRDDGRGYDFEDCGLFGGSECWMDLELEKALADAGLLNRVRV